MLAASFHMGCTFSCGDTKRPASLRNPLSTTRASSNTLDAAPAGLSAGTSQLQCDRGACKDLQQHSITAYHVVNAAADGSAQLVVALPLSQTTLDSFVQGVNPAHQAVLTLSAITQEEVGKVTSLSFRPEPVEQGKAVESTSGSCYVVHGGRVQQGPKENAFEIGVRRRSSLLPSPTQRPMLSDVEIGSLLGRGAYGYVYLGKWLSANVAIKIDGQSPSTDLEAILSLDIAHPHIVQTYHYCSRPLHQQAGCQAVAAPFTRGQARGVQGSTHLGQDMMAHPGGRRNVQATRGSGSHREQDDATDKDESRDNRETWMVLEYCDKGSLQGAMDHGWLHQKGGRPNMQHILRCAIEIGGALRYLHSRSILHGDLTGSNVLLCSCARDSRGWICKVSDFGLSRVLDGDSCYTKTYGTVTHMPPELMLNGCLSKAADVYSFGVLLWELYTGQRPWAGLRHAKIVVTVTLEGKQLDFPFGTPQRFKALAESCMARSHAQRPTFDKILKDLEWLESGPTSELQTEAFPLHVL
ncbi:hypothetical protein WJX74_003878 [Apatococcus lobatus]|uniref:Protein kinase domain-containing protein n=2 Tax=Apatococcus TaxID=904362 RepID=A0AAW1QXI3_9CHLO